MKRLLKKILFVLCIVVSVCPVTNADDGYGLWLSCKKLDDAKTLKEYQKVFSCIVVEGQSETLGIVREEIKKGLDGLLGADLPIQSTLTKGALVIGTPRQSQIIQKLDLSKKLADIGREGFLIKSVKIDGNPTVVIAANEDIGLLYGTFDLLRLMQMGQSLKKVNISSKPRIQYRLLDHWDRLDGSISDNRGYAGKSLWKWDELPETVDPRYKDYARANASIGINGVVPNSVNADPAILKAEYLKKVAKLAEVFRPYGIRVFLSVNFSSPISAKFDHESNRRGGIGNLKTSDPCDPKVKQWWKDKAKEIYQLIPDFGGFLVKASSEGMPGPQQEYNRTHADGTNMLAEALAPYGGVVMWRSFVYNADVDPDRSKRAYLEFVPFDGKFSPNVFIQTKNGPIDFQPREPVNSLFGAMPKTPLMLELQIMQEYLGHSTHLVYLAPMWKEYLEFDTYAKGKGSTLASIIDGSSHNYKMTGIAGVTNTGDDRNWCGHIFGQANWYAFGRLGWDPGLSSETIAEEWIRMTLSRNDKAVKEIESMMMGSREACVNYMTPLGLHHIMQEGFHYGPQPSLDKSGRIDWTSVYYHRADANGLGFDRSSTGSNATSQYFPPNAKMFDSLKKCPEKYLLWFHHVPWGYKMKSGRTLWDELCYRYYTGVDYVKEMEHTWAMLEKDVDPEIYLQVKRKLSTQEEDAAIWRDTCTSYFQKFSNRPVPAYK
ncbi:MAG: alpha-glucuronidase family glycosyl hydrolase [Phycisphaerae bacterium]|nr:alpha-glucuronidase family glycosyl hydrolase [Phycisphaerae bacterium]MDD5381036.1 alpha-glucuronidase family glycosyl hydrolase [Phycisphaerae bacterium]